MRQFIIFWVGAVISSFGSTMANFALGVWVFQETGSVSQYALIGLVASIPSLIGAPLAGAIIDRHRRKRVLIIGDLAAASATTAMALAAWYEALTVWNLAALLVVTAICGLVRQVASLAVTTLLVPKSSLSRANGMMQAGFAASSMLAPLVAGALVVELGLFTVLLIDAATFLASILALTWVKIPEPVDNNPTRAGTKHLRRDLLFGARYLLQRPGLSGLLGYFATTNLFLTMVSILVPPLVLLQADASALGTVMFVAASGSLVGGLVVSVWGGPRGKVRFILGGGFVVGLCVTQAGLHPTVPVIAASVCTAMFVAPTIAAASQALWQTKVAPEHQGRVFSLRIAVARSMTPVAYAITGPLTDRVLEPAMSAGGTLATILGPLFGTAKGSGMAVLVFGTGCLMLAATSIATIHPRIRRLESELSDAPPSSADREENQDERR